MPQADPIVRAEQVRLIDEDYSTPKRERVAEYIEQHWNESRGLTLTEIAEKTETSRQHVKNVLEDHFEMVDKMDDTGKTAVPERDGVDAELLRVVLNAYRIGLRDGASDDVEPGLTDELLELAKRD